MIPRPTSVATAANGWLDTRLALDVSSIEDRPTCIAGCIRDHPSAGPLASVRADRCWLFPASAGLSQRGVLARRRAHQLLRPVSCPVVQQPGHRALDNPAPAATGRRGDARPRSGLGRTADRQATARLVRWPLRCHHPGRAAFQHLPRAGGGRQPVRQGRPGTGRTDAGLDGAHGERDVGLGADRRARRQRTRAAAADREEPADPPA